MATVVFYDSDEGRASLVAAVAAACGALQVRRALRASDLRGAQALLVALDAPLAGLEAALREAADAGAKTVGYARGASRWSTVQQCEALLSGAARLLDSDTPAFAEALGCELTGLLREAQQAAQAQEALRRHMRAAGCVARSARFLQVFRLVTRLAELSDIPVLMEGESGTGKELLAKALHRLDPKRSKGPFVAVNCAAVSPALAESELFGHVRGAFTGAGRQRQGLLRAAAGGVLFLDEIGEMSLELQAKMLRVLQDGRVMPVGDERATAADIRVVAATNRDLAAMAREGRFRVDLYHRLRVIPVHLPPLRERPEDVDALLEHFVEKHGHLAPVPACTAPGLAGALRRLALPGNARQLENLVRQALVGKRDAAPLALRDFPPEVWRELSVRGRAAAEPAQAAAQDAGGIRAILSVHRWKLSDSLSHCERSMIDAALVHTNGNRTKAAQLLGITPRSIYNKLRRHP